MIEPALALWPEDPARVDLLSFDAVAKTVTYALLDEALDPVALGLSGSWGGGKTTVHGPVAQESDRRATELLDYAWLRRNDTPSQESLL